MSGENKVLVIGLDGASFNILNPLIEEGRMPTIKKIINEGVSGILKSVIPIHSMSAWTSFMTGNRIDKHGVFDFRKRIKGDYYKKEIYNSSMIKTETIFQILSRNEKFVEAFNIPNTYPPSKLKGYMLTGAFALKNPEKVTFPPKLFKELVDKFGEYPWGKVNYKVYNKNNIGQIIEDVISLDQKWYKVVDYLMPKLDWSLSCIVFIGPDRIQHPLYRLLVNSSSSLHCSYSEKEKGYISKLKDYYTFLDQLIDKLIEKAGEETNIFIISDHGFHGCYKQFVVNSFLEEIGLLTYNKKTSNLYNLLNKFDFPLIKRIRRASFSNISGYSKFFAGSSIIDWNKTKAFSPLDSQRAISINLIGREPSGIVSPGREYETIRQTIRKALLDLKDPVTNKKVIKDVFFKEELFNEHISDPFLPDIFFLPIPETIYTGKEKLNNFEPLERTSGDHDLNGIFLAYGKNIKNKYRINNTEIIDITPTILYQLQVPIPKIMDGKVLTSIFKQDFIAKNEVIYEEFLNQQHSSQSYNQEEQAEIENELKGLGYL